MGNDESLGRNNSKMIKIFGLEDSDHGFSTAIDHIFTPSIN